MPKKRILALAVAFALGGAIEAKAQVGSTTLPTGGTVSAGAATIGRSGAAMTIQQSSGKAVLDWRSFSIGSQASVAFQQPSSSAIALNRVLGSSASEIYGRLSANGQVFLVNPNGVLFGRGAQVDVGGLLASTLWMSSEDFMAGRHTLAGGGSAGVVNQGALRAAPRGYVALVGPQVANEGTIEAPSGSVVLAAGSAATVDFMADGLVRLRIDQGALAAEARNSGLIAADGGAVFLKAESLDDLAPSVVNTSGIIEARTVEEADGVVRLGGISLEADHVAVTGAARLDVSGESGGGEILVGGNAHGAGPEKNAARTFVGPDAILEASATGAGDGGKVVVWSNDETRFFGTIRARGGAQGGDGGFVETSGGVLQASGSVDAAAPLGSAGSWLLDPKNIFVLATGSAFNPAENVFTANPSGDSFVLASSLDGAQADVLLQANTDIMFGAPVSIRAQGVNLTAQAGRQVAVNANIATTNGNITLVGNDTGADLNNRDAGIGGVFMSDGTTITAGTGNVILRANDDPTGSGAPGDIRTIDISASNISLVATGNARLDGALAADSPTGIAGVDISAGSVSATNATVSAAGGSASETGARHAFIGIFATKGDFDWTGGSIGAAGGTSTSPADANIELGAEGRLNVTGATVSVSGFNPDIDVEARGDVTLSNSRLQGTALNEATTIFVRSMDGNISIAGGSTLAVDGAEPGTALNDADTSNVFLVAKGNISLDGSSIAADGGSGVGAAKLYAGTIEGDGGFDFLGGGSVELRNGARVDVFSGATPSRLGTPGDVEMQGDNLTLGSLTHVEANSTGGPAEVRLSADFDVLVDGLVRTNSPVIEGSGSAPGDGGIFIDAGDRILTTGTGLLDPVFSDGEPFVSLSAVNGIGTIADPIRVGGSADLWAKNTGTAGDLAIAFTSGDVDLLAGDDMVGFFNNNPNGTYYVLAETGGFNISRSFLPNDAALLPGQHVNLNAGAGAINIGAGGSIMTSGAGTITLLATNTTGSGAGVFLDVGSELSSLSGGISVDGVAAAGPGVVLAGSIGSNSGNIDIVGDGGTRSDNVPVFGVGTPSGVSPTIRTSTGSILIDGVGGTSSGGGSATGVLVDGGFIEGANVQIVGQGGSSPTGSAAGVALNGVSVSASSGVDISGLGGEGGDLGGGLGGAPGVLLGVGAAPAQTFVASGGSLSIFGTGGIAHGAGASGIVARLASLQSLADLSLDGTGDTVLAGDGAAVGVSILQSSVLATDVGNVVIAGQGGDTPGAGGAHGVAILDGSEVGTFSDFVNDVFHTGTGSVTIDGSGGSASGSGNAIGVLLSTSQTASGGNVVSDSGDIDIGGVGGAASTGDTRGVALRQGSRISSTGGSILILGSGSVAGVGINAAAVQTGGDLELAGNGDVQLANATLGADTLAASMDGVLRIEPGTTTFALTQPFNNTGSLDIAAGATLSTGGLDVFNSGTLTGAGTLDLAGAATLHNDGGINPGGVGVVGTLTVAGNYANGSSGSLAVDLAGPASYDVLAVTGSATLNGGTLTASFLNGYTPTSGGHNVLTAGSLSGQLATVLAGALLPTYGSTMLSLDLAALVNQWIGTSGDWADPLNWSLGHAPTAAEDVQVADLQGQQTLSVSTTGQAAKSFTFLGDEILAIAGGALSYGAASSVANLDLASGTLSGTGDLAVSNGYSQTGGLLDVTGNVTIAAAGSVSQTGGAIRTSGLLTVSSTGGQALGGANFLAGFSAVNSGSGDIVLVNTSPALALHSVSTPGNIDIDTSGSMSGASGNLLSAPNIALAAIDGITGLNLQTGSLSVSNVNNAVTLSNTGVLALNSVTNTNGSFLLDNAGDVSVLSPEQVGGTFSITVHSDIDVLADITANTTGAASGSSVVLTADGAITQDPTTVLEANGGTLVFTASGPITLGGTLNASTIIINGVCSGVCPTPPPAPTIDTLATVLSTTSSTTGGSTSLVVNNVDFSTALGGDSSPVEVSDSLTSGESTEQAALSPGGGAQPLPPSVAYLVTLMEELRKKKDKALEKAVEILERDPGIADLKPCTGKVSGDCIAPRPAKPRRGEAPQWKLSYLPAIERKVAVLIGEADYTGGIPKLDSPVKDIEEIGAIYEQRFGYEVRRLPNAGKEEIVQALNRLILESGPNDSVIVFYAGHGQVVERTGRGYWIPAKSSADDPSQWLSNADIARFLENIPARQVLLVSDSCYSGTLTREAKLERGDVLSDPAAVLARRSVAVLSSGGEEPVADAGKNGHSVFAWHFMQNLKRVERWANGVDVYSRLAEGVKRDFPQEPQYGAALGSGHQPGGDFLFEVRRY
ncbi:MAG TPA: filamentous hemagglutinin N-terminal domain-containing protein [Burkholderiales bacterium]